MLRDIALNLRGAKESDRLTKQGSLFVHICG